MSVEPEPEMEKISVRAAGEASMGGIVAPGGAVMAPALSLAVGPGPGEKPGGGLSHRRFKARLYYFLVFCPGINVFFDLFIGEPPRLEDLNTVWNAVAIVDALILTVVLSYPGSISYDDLVAADLRYATNPALNAEALTWEAKGVIGRQGSNTSLSGSLLYSICWAAGLLAASLFSIIITLILGSASSGRMNDYGSMRRWWAWGKYLVLGQITLCIGGIWNSFAAIEIVILIRFPDYQLQASSITTASDAVKMASTIVWTPGWDYPLLRFPWFLNGILFAVIFVTLVFFSIFVARRHQSLYARQSRSERAEAVAAEINQRLIAEGGLPGAVIADDVRDRLKDKMLDKFADEVV